MMRSILTIAAKIFDPLGLLGPFVIRLKIMFITLCMEKVDWDKVLEKELVKQRKVILAGLGTLSGVKIDRCYFIANATPTKIQLHGFCDASVEAYAAVLYVQTVYSDNSFSVSMLASKTRACPRKAQTIPHLELLAAVILSRLLQQSEIACLFLWRCFCGQIRWWFCVGFRATNHANNISAAE